MNKIKILFLKRMSVRRIFFNSEIEIFKHHMNIIDQHGLLTPVNTKTLLFSSTELIKMLEDEKFQKKLIKQVKDDLQEEFESKWTRNIIESIFYTSSAGFLCFTGFELHNVLCFPFSFVLLYIGIGRMVEIPKKLRILNDMPVIDVLEMQIFEKLKSVPEEDIQNDPIIVNFMKSKKCQELD